MKKGIKTLAAAALAVSALTPVAAAAASNIADGVYTSTDYYTLPAFKQLSTTDKAAALQSTGAVVVLGGQAYKATDVLSATDAQLPTLGTAADTYTTAAGNKLVSGQKLDTPTTPVPGELKVESVSAINASELKVTFSQTVDKESATTKANYQLRINNNAVPTAHIADIQLAEDKKSVTILLDQSSNTKGFQSGEKYVIQTTDGIKSESGTKAQKFVSSELTFDQSVAPQLSKVEKMGSKLRLTFDRPVDALTDVDTSAAGNQNVTLVKLDGIALTSKDLVAVNKLGGASGNADVLGKAGAYVYEVEIDSALLTAANTVGNHEVIIYDVKETAKDYAKNASVVRGTYTISNTAGIPEVKEVTAVNSNRFFIETSEAVVLNASSKVIVTKGTHEFTKVDTVYDDGLSVSQTKADATPGKYNNKDGIWVVVTDEATTGEENPLYKAGETSVNLQVTLENYAAATGGKLGAKATKSVTLNKNSNKPVIVQSKNALNPASNGTLNVVFQGELAQLDGTTSLPGLASTDVVVRDKDGVIVQTGTVTAAYNSTTKETTVSIAGPSATVKYEDSKAPYSVEFKAEKFRNKLVTNSVSGYAVNTLKNDVMKTTVGTNHVNFEYAQFGFAAAIIPSGSTDEDKIVAAQTALTNSTTAGEYYVNQAKSTIIFNYNQDMDSSAINPANYTLDGVALPAGTTVDFVGNKKVVKVTLPTGYLKNTTQYKFGITENVKTAQGSKIVSSLQTKAPAELLVSFADSIKPELAATGSFLVNVSTPQATTTTTQIELTFNEKVTIDASHDELNDLLIVAQGSSSTSGLKVASVAQPASTEENYEYKLVVTLDTPVNVNQALTVTIVDEIAQGATAQQDGKEIAITDIAGNKAKAGATSTISGSKYSVAYAAAIKSAAISQANTKLGALGFTSVNSISTAANLTTAKTQYNEAKTAVDAALAAGATTGDLTGHAGLATQNTEILRFEGVAADIAAAVAALATPTVAATGADLGTLPLTGTNGTIITWTSATPAKLSNAGAYGTGGAAAGEVVVLTATISKAGGEAATVKFNVSINDTKITGITKQ